MYIIALALVLGLAPVAAEERVTSSALRAEGIDLNSLQPIAFSHNDRWLAAFDRAPFEEKVDGIFYRLWFFPIAPDGKIGQPKKVPLSLRSFQQGEFTPNDREFVIMGERGTTFQKLSLSTWKIEPLMEPEWGRPGFRSDPAVLWSEGGQLYALGHPYDRERFVSPTTIAKVEPSKVGAEAFEPGPDLTTFERGVERLWFTSYLNQRSGFVGQRYPQTTLMSHWNGDSLSEFDRSSQYFGFWSAADRLLYSCQRESPSTTELVIYDAKSKQKTTLYQGPETFRYVFLSRDGRTAQASQISAEDKRLIPYYAQQRTNWELRPVLLDNQQRPRSVSAGWVRLSSAGKLMCHIGPTGLVIYHLP